jgi:hypothetical protein
METGSLLGLVGLGAITLLIILYVIRQATMLGNVSDSKPDTPDAGRVHRIRDQIHRGNGSMPTQTLEGYINSLPQTGFTLDQIVSKPIDFSDATTAQIKALLRVRSEYANLIYVEEIASRLPPAAIGKYIAVNLKTHDYHVDDDDLIACETLRAKGDEGEIVFLEIPSPPSTKSSARGNRELLPV